MLQKGKNEDKIKMKYECDPQLCLLIQVRFLFKENIFHYGIEHIFICISQGGIIKFTSQERATSTKYFARESAIRGVSKLF